MKQFVEYTGGPLYYNDSHFNDEEEMFDYCDDDNIFEAELVDEQRLGYQLTPASIYEYIEERIFEEMEDPDLCKIQGVDELLKALKTFLDAQTQTICVPNGKFVRLERPKENT